MGLKIIEQTKKKASDEMVVDGGVRRGGDGMGGVTHPINWLIN